MTDLERRHLVKAPQLRILDIGLCRPMSSDRRPARAQCQGGQENLQSRCGIDAGSQNVFSATADFELTRLHLPMQCLLPIRNAMRISGRCLRNDPRAKDLEPWLTGSKYGTFGTIYIGIQSRASAAMVQPILTHMTGYPDESITARCHSQLPPAPTPCIKKADLQAAIMHYAPNAIVTMRETPKSRHQFGRRQQS